MELRDEDVGEVHVFEGDGGNSVAASGEAGGDDAEAGYFVSGCLSRRVWS